MNNQSAIITVTQGDFLYIEEWIQYHKKLGIDLMIIGFNGKPENFEKLPKYDFIRYIDFSIRKDNIIHQEFDRKGKGFSAIELYKPTYSISFMCRCLNILLDYIKYFYPSVKYVFPIDTDEFLTIKNKDYDNINRFLIDNYDESQPSKLINMVYMSDNNQIYYEDRPVLERFTEERPIEYYNFHTNVNRYFHTKSVINIRHEDILSNFAIISSPHNISFSTDEKFDEDQLVLRHFFTKSLEEYIRKFTFRYDNDYFFRFQNMMIYIYFRYNELTEEKLYAWNELCEKYNVHFDIYKQYKPAPYTFINKMYCKLFNKDYNRIIENYKQLKKHNLI